MALNWRTYVLESNVNPCYYDIVRRNVIIHNLHILPLLRRRYFYYFQKLSFLLLTASYNDSMIVSYKPISRRKRMRQKEIDENEDIQSSAP
jgi:hypothetical protein